MDFWVTKLREQTSQIAEGSYLPGEPAFTRGPAGVVELSQELDILAPIMSERAAAHNVLSHEVHPPGKNNTQIVSSMITMTVNTPRQHADGGAPGLAIARIDLTTRVEG